MEIVRRVYAEGSEEEEERKEERLTESSRMN
jgi:hypothetical protein